ncbi:MULTISPECIES: MotB family protein [Alphaproteobacteria]|uniref:Flagellar motor protein MotB n=2 Tax=Alphaproteobacteria TaxID=28211 RepID=A0A512HIG8_9HYPH|nr:MULTISPECIES: MotB family protein [Alphaproteobacteria]GEO85246.1 flagellar motor protein MotB [Ciceribacter naphthalenivorans]GLR24420.1 flagellar motor protein MotB [Ciceribacter naphthalenivorans]GLT07276.1 flagellar motor protein MotB [Sphingomonas psychrolutea]
MSDSENHHHGKNEIIIIKRHGGGDHDGAHGGAWKIAYADFMTAMMAFFLVMWLVNAANEETKASVASYFNPIKLSDEKPTEKGLKKPVDQADGEQKQERSQVDGKAETVGSAAASGEDQTTSSGDQTNYSEADLFENPYSVLAEIAQEVGQQANVSAKGEGGASDSGPSTGAEGGEAYRDPFDPDFWTQQVQNLKGKPGKQDTSPTTVENVKPSDGEQQVALVTPKQKPADPLAEVAQVGKSEMTKDGKSEKTGAEAVDAKMKAAEALKADIEKEIGGVSGKLAEGLIVTPAEGGLLVTITDQQDAPMFNVGSAVPRKDLVVAMERIGKLLAGRQGAIVIRGHTDGRQFKGVENDNWRLSMARAHSAYYMLVRGGLSEARVEQVSGFADRRLQVPNDPLADANRRIEILIQADQG